MVIHDLDLVNLSLWLIEFNAGPVALISFCATKGSIPQSEPVLRTIGYFIESDKVIVVVELIDGWEVSVLLTPYWKVRFRVSPTQNFGKLVL